LADPPSPLCTHWTRIWAIAFYSAMRVFIKTSIHRFPVDKRLVAGWSRAVKRSSFNHTSWDGSTGACFEPVYLYVSDSAKLLIAIANSKASLTLARRTVYTMARNLACQWRKNSWQHGRGSMAMRVRWSRACRVVAKILTFHSKVSLIVMTKLLSAHAWHSASRISWTGRNLCVTDGTTWHKLCVTLPSWQT